MKVSVFKLFVLNENKQKLVLFRKITNIAVSFFDVNDFFPRFCLSNQNHGV